MNRETLLKKILLAAGRDRKRREDPRYRQVMGFLIAKGFLKANRELPLLPNHRIAIHDAIWAGAHVEPRILEVLPAAVLRLPRHFDLNPTAHPELFATVEKLKRGDKNADSLWGIPYQKFLPWVHLPLRDRRIKSLTEKRVTKTFRLKPSVVEVLKRLSIQWECTETEALERLVKGDYTQ